MNILYIHGMGGRKEQFRTQKTTTSVAANAVYQGW